MTAQAQRPEPLTVILKVGLFLFLYIGSQFLLVPLLRTIGGDLFAFTLGGFSAAALSNALVMRIYERQSLADVGFWWNGSAARNLAFGLAGGIGAACLVLCGPLLVKAARFHPAPVTDTNWRSILFVSLLLLFGSVGEEMCFRGYPFQLLLKSLGPYATILPTGVVFGALHSVNPGASAVSILNTVGFGVVFGYAFWRSRDLWLPIGMHFGWNFTLPLFGVNLSGLTIRVTGYEMEWTSGEIWSGGRYGPEASILTSLVLIVLAFYVWKTPIRPNAASLVKAPVEY